MFECKTGSQPFCCCCRSMTIPYCIFVKVEASYEVPLNLTLQFQRSLLKQLLVYIHTYRHGPITYELTIFVHKQKIIQAYRDIRLYCSDLISNTNYLRSYCVLGLLPNPSILSPTLSVLPNPSILSPSLTVLPLWEPIPTGKQDH